MSMFKYNDQNKSHLSHAINELRTMMAENGSAVANKAFTDTILSMESANDTSRDSLEQTAHSVQGQIEAIFGPVLEEMGLGVESLTPAQLEAGVVAALAAGDPLNYARQAINTKVKPDGETPIIDVAMGSNGSFDYRLTPSNESFDEAAITKMIPYSIAWNVQAARQNQFAETFFPTTIVSPEIGGVDIEIDYTTVMNYTKRNLNGNPAEFNKTNLLEAAFDHTVLEDESTAIVPYMAEDDSNADRFVSDSLLTPRDVKVGDVEVRTSALKPGQEVDLLGLSSHPGLLGAGVLDNTDSIHPRIVLKTLYFMNEVDDGAGNTVQEVFKFDTSRLPSNAFIDSIEGHQRSMLLNFQTDSLLIAPTTKLVDNSDPLSNSEARTGDYTIRIGLNVFGNANVEFGTVSVNGSGIKVVSITDPTGESLALTSGAGQTMADKIAGMQLIGYELEAARTNTNRRTRGMMLNNTGFKERYSIPLGAPISMPSPTGTDRDTKDLQSLVVAANLRNNSNAVTTLLNYRDMLSAYVDNRTTGLGNLTIDGIARHVVVPTFVSDSIDFAVAMNSIRAKDRAEDIASTFINKLRDIVYRMMRDSRYQTALDTSSFGSKKPVVIIGTDPVIKRHLMVEGDTRTMGIGFGDEEVRIVDSVDGRMKDKIIITLSRGGSAAGVDPLAFGTHAWIPELASTMQITRNGATINEAMVQPRSRHIPHLPIMAEITVTNLKEVMASKVAQPTTTP